MLLSRANGFLAAHFTLPGLEKVRASVAVPAACPCDAGEREVEGEPDEEAASSRLLAMGA